MKPSWRQLTRFTVAIILLLSFVSMFSFMGWSIVRHSGNTDSLSSLVTDYGMWVAIVGAFLTPIIKDLFQSDDE